MAERWKVIPGFPEYDVSSQGRVRSYWADNWHVAQVPQRLMRQRRDIDGYWVVGLRVSGKLYMRKVSALVLLAFVGPRPKGKQTCHNDSDQENNALSNLRYDTIKGNMSDKSEDAKRMSMRKLTNEQVVEIRERYASDRTLSYKSLAQEYGMCKTAIAHVCTGRTFPHLDGPRTQERYSKISNATAKEILSRARNENITHLAAEYGIHRSTITKWRQGKYRSEMTID